MLNFGLPAFGFALGALAFAVLGALIAVGPRRDMVHWALVLGALLSAIWLGLTAFIRADFLFLPLRGLTAFEVFRSLAWAAVPCLYALAGERLLGGAFGQRVGRSVVLYLGVAVLLSLLALGSLAFGRGKLDTLTLIPLLGLAITGLAGVELLYRNTHSDDRWAVKYLCLGIGLVFGYDVYLYAEAALFGGYSPEAWLARGAVNAMAVPPMLIAVRRDPKRPLRVFVSRHVVFHGATLIAVGGYLMLLAVAGFYVKTMGGSWGGTLRIVLVAAGLMLLSTLLLSGEARAQLRQFLIRHFYQNKYDYAEQWLKFTERLANPGEEMPKVAESVLRAVMQPVESTGGILYALSQRGQLEALARVEFADPELETVALSARLRRRLAEEHVVTIAEVAALAPNLTEFTAQPRAWALVPMVHDSDLIAVILLAVPRVNAQPGAEDRELLLTLGKQSAALLALVRANQRLAESRQFDAFSRLSAFVVHDVKNVVAQLELINRNAERHRDNPEFVEDAFNTVGSAVARMNRLLAGLRKASNPGTDGGVFSLNALVEDACGHCLGRTPRPEYQPMDQEVWMEGDSERLLHALEHLITNAQEATIEQGFVRITLQMVQEAGTHADEVGSAVSDPCRDDSLLPDDLGGEAGLICITIEDDGCGMSREFINTRLFAPFVTTKGNSGMGIGVFEARHVVESWGGSLEVQSTPGQGTRFDIYLPVDTERAEA